MATSPGKTIAFILLVVIIIYLALRLTPLFIAPFGVFTGMFRSLHIPGIDEIRIKSFIPALSMSFLSFALLILWIVVIVWVYRDAERRGMNGVLWALLVLIGNIIGLIIYLLVRSDTAVAARGISTQKTCSCCSKPIGATHVFCPHCGTRLEAICPQCKKPVEENWKVCPLCGEKLKE